MGYPALQGLSTTHQEMFMDQSNRSVLKTSTQEFKIRFREYLKDLAKDDDQYRLELLQALEWCFDRWEHWRQRFYPDADLMFPFFQSGRRGSEFGHYATVGDSGQPSVIHIKRSYLMGTADTTVVKLSATKKLVLKADHPDRLKFVDQTILHELVHQYLYEASPDALAYDTTEAGSNRYKGHGPLFAAECNRINQILHPELGFQFVPVRHSKKSHAKVKDRQRPSCANFTHGELFFAWDRDDPELTREQTAENRRRLEQALKFYGGAVELVEEAVAVPTDFPAPYAPDCADVCIQQLSAYDKAKGTNLLANFVQAVLNHAGASVAPVHIPPAEGENGSQVLTPAARVAVPESGPTVPATGDTSDCPVQIGDTVTHPQWGSCEVRKIFRAVEQDGWNLAIDTNDGARIVSFDSLGTVPTTGDSPATLSEAYPFRDPARSLMCLMAHIKKSGLTKADFARERFGHKNGQQLSRHLKQLRQAMAQKGVAA